MSRTTSNRNEQSNAKTIVLRDTARGGTPTVEQMKKNRIIGTYESRLNDELVSSAAFFRRLCIPPFSEKTMVRFFCQVNEHAGFQGRSCPTNPQSRRGFRTSRTWHGRCNAYHHGEETELYHTAHIPKHGESNRSVRTTSLAQACRVSRTNTA